MQRLKMTKPSPSNVIVLLAAFFIPALTASVAKASDSASTNYEREKYQRIVSIDGSLTEVIYALNQQHRLVGVDTSSRYPKEATELPDVGYVRNLSPEGILSLEPDLIIISDQAKPQAAVEKLRRSGVEMLKISDHHDWPTVINKVTAIAEKLGVSREGNRLLEELEIQHQRLQQTLANRDGKSSTKVLMILSGGTHSSLVFGNQSKGDGVLRLVAATNAVNQFNGIKPITKEGLLSYDADAIVVAAFRPNLDLDTALPHIKHTRAAKSNRIYILDAQRLLGFGPRTGSAVNQLADFLYDQQS